MASEHQQSQLATSEATSSPPQANSTDRPLYTTATTMTEESTPPAKRTRWPAAALLFDFTIMVAMVGLDMRDLWYKTRWIGPDDSFSFTATASQTLQNDTLLSLATDLNRSSTAVGSVLPRPSGWSSFLATCEELHPIANGPFFLHALGRNCSIGASSFVAPELIFVASFRADSLAWAACRLLRNDRKPVICRSAIVKGFASRYNIVETPAQISYSSRGNATYSHMDFQETSPPIVNPDTPAESELLGLLAVISRSAPPLSRLTCVEGFVHRGPGHYTSSIFGCASATRFESAFVGHHATDIASLLQNKAWLTSDVLRLFGMQYIIRQNSWSHFHVSSSPSSSSSSTIAVEHVTRINFSSSGILYTVEIAIDVVLLVFNFISTIEIASLVLFPLVQEVFSYSASGNTLVADDDTTPFAFDDYKATLTCPLFRSTPLAALMLFSQSLSWMLVFPNSVIWTWTESWNGKMQAYLSTLRIWIVPLILVNLNWNLIVYFGEKAAYKITRCAYISIKEIFLIASLVAYLKRSAVFAIGSTKYAMDSQRVTDFETFHKGGLLAFGNGFPETQDAQQTASGVVTEVLYAPFVAIILWSLLAIAVRIALRFVYHYVRCTPSTVVVVPTSHSSSSIKSTGTSASSSMVYQRLPIEALLNLPIRARSLIRDSFQMETTIENKTFLRPSCYVDHGIVMEHHKLRTRQGFFGTIRYSTDAAPHLMPQPAVEAPALVPSVLPPPRPMARSGGSNTSRRELRQRHILKPLR